GPGSPCLQCCPRALPDPGAVRPSAVRIPGSAVEVRRNGRQTRIRPTAPVPRRGQCRWRPAVRVRDQRGEDGLQPGRLGSFQRSAAGHGRLRLLLRGAGGILRQTHPRLDDRRWLHRDSEEPYRRRCVWSPVRSASTQSLSGRSQMNDMIDAATANALLKPRSIALVGISDDAAKTNGRPLRFLRAAGYPGTIYNVNPTRTEVQGEPAYPSLSALPEVPEYAFILTNSQLAIDAVEECGRLGIRVATILAGGFSESGPEGAAREQQLRVIAERT